MPAIVGTQMEGLPALRREFEACGTEVDLMCMRYVLDQEAGSCDTPFQNNLKLDSAADGSVHTGRLLDGPAGERRGKRLADFVDHPKARLAQLSEAEVAGAAHQTPLIASEWASACLCVGM